MNTQNMNNKKVILSPRIKTGRYWQVQIDPNYEHLRENYAFLAKRQSISPVFNDKTYRYELGPVNNRYTDEQIQALVKKASWTDPMTNQKITEADPTNKRDPFFTHTKCKAKLSNEAVQLDLNRFEDELVYAIVSADPLCIVGKTSLSQNPSAEWIIEDEEVDATHRESKRERSIRIHETFKELSPSEKRKLFTALGGKLTGTEKDSIIADWLYIKITEGDKQTLNLNQEIFLELTNPENKGTLDVTVMVEELYNFGILRKENNAVLFNGEKLTVDANNLVNFLTKPENSSLFIGMEEALEAKKRTN